MSAHRIKLKKPDGYTVSAIEKVPEDPRGIVIAVHGFSSSKECPTFQMLLDRLPAAGYGMVGIDLPGHGTEESAEEPLRIEACLNSIQAAECHARGMWPDREICYFASSFGAYNTALYISRREHAGRRVFFRSAAVNMPSLFIKEHPTEKELQMMTDLEEKGYFVTGIELGKPVKVTREMYHDLETTDLFDEFRPQAFGRHLIAMAHGAEDEIIDPNEARRFSERFHIPAVFFEGEGHSLSNDPQTPYRVAELAVRLYGQPLVR